MCIVHICILPLLTMTRSPPRGARRKHGPAKFLQLCRCRLGFTHIINPRLQVSLVFWIMLVEYHYMSNWSPVCIIFKIACEQYRPGFRYYCYSTLRSKQLEMRFEITMKYNLQSHIKRRGLSYTTICFLETARSMTKTGLIYYFRYSLL